ncbi:MAG: hypothetical protein QOI34_125, partial [Verrucomicrobiota bacterium]
KTHDEEGNHGPVAKEGFRALVTRPQLIFAAHAYHGSFHRRFRLCRPCYRRVLR